MLSYDEIKRLVQDSNPGVSEGELFATTQRVWEGALSAYVYRVNHPDPDIRNDRSPIVVAPGEPAQVQADAAIADAPPAAPIQTQETTAVDPSATAQAGASGSLVPVGGNGLIYGQQQQPTQGQPPAQQGPHGV